MRTIAVVSGKGGVGKTTLASALGVRATLEDKGRSRVAMVDLDPQRSLVMWWERRGRSNNPEIFANVDTATDAVERLLLTQAPNFLFVDTPPAFVATMEDAIANADLVLIPLRPGMLDLVGTEVAIVLAREAGKARLCVINDSEPRWKTTHQAHAFLRKQGVPVAETIICHRAAYLAAMSTGRTGPEVDKSRDKAAATEIDELWTEVKAALRKSKGGRE